MKKEDLKALITVAGGRQKADLVIKNCRVLNVFSGRIIQGDIAISGDQIAGIGQYDGEIEIDAQGKFASPGFIDSHIHIESSYLCPEELGRLLVPNGGTTIIADPHEIVNVAGIPALDYMMRAAARSKMDIKFALPSCVPATAFENAGAVVNSEDMEEPIKRDQVIGLGEFMNYPGVIMCDDEVLNKLMVAKDAGKIIDGHSPGLYGKDLSAYCAARILADHECETIEDFTERIDRGMYVMLRQGSACKNLEVLLPAVTPENSRRVVFCSDDRQPATIIDEGHINDHLKRCVAGGLDAMTAIRIATLNAAECFGLTDRGALAPGYRADIVLLDDLKDFKVSKVFIAGELVAQDGEYLPSIEREDISPVAGSVHLKDFSREKLEMNLKTNKVHTIQLLPGGVVTRKSIDLIDLKDGEFVFNPDLDIVKAMVAERHKMTGNVACGFLKGYGIKRGAVALSIAHDSHNIIAAGVSDEEIAFAVEALAEQNGGIVVVNGGKLVASMPMPIAGLMSDQSGQWVESRLKEIHKLAHEELGVSGSVDPVMTLCFMSLAVIPEIKLTDTGLFDVTKFEFIPVEAE